MTNLPPDCVDGACAVTEASSRSVREILAEGLGTLTRLRVLVHILIFTGVLMLPAALLVSYFIAEFFRLEGVSGLASEAKLSAQKNKELQALLQETLITSDLVYGSGVIYLVPGAIRQNNLVASRMVENGEALGFEAEDLSNAVAALAAIEADLGILPRLDETQLDNHINEFLPRYDDHVDVVIALSQNLIEASRNLTEKFDAAYVQQRRRIEREIVVFGGLYIAFVLLVLRLHLNQFVRPITQLNLSAREAISNESPLDLVLNGPKEYQELSMVLKRYDQRLEFRMRIQQLANSLSFQLMKAVPESEIAQVAVLAISESLTTDSVDHFKVSAPSEGAGEVEQVTASAQDLGLTSEGISSLGLSASNSCCYWPKLDPGEPRSELSTEPAHRRLNSSEAFGAVRTDVLIAVFSKAEISRVYILRGLEVPERSAENLMALQQISDVLAVIDEKAAFDRELEFRVQSRTRELSKQTEIALKAQRAQASFLTTISHEIRTPFNSLIGMAEVLRQSNLDSDQQIAADALANAGNRLLQVVTTMFEYAMLDSNKYEVAWNRLDTRTFSEQVRAQFEARARAQNCRFSISVDDSEGLGFEIDNQALTRIVQVLLENALRFGAGGRVDFELLVTIIDQDWLRLEINVSDEGPGVGPDQVANLFEPFVQGGELAQGGLGLGLAIAQRYAKQLGGEIVLDPNHVKGSRFLVELTCLRTLPLLEEFELIEAASTHLQTQSLRFLLIKNQALPGNFNSIAQRFELQLDYVDTVQDQLQGFMENPSKVVVVFSKKSELDWFMDHCEPLASRAEPKMILLVEPTAETATQPIDGPKVWLTPATIKRATEQLISL